MKAGDDASFRVEIRKKKNARRFDSSRYPGFSYKKTGKYAYHWEAVVGTADLPSIRSRAASDGYEVKAVPVEYTRSGGYRTAFLTTHPGPYRCRYCNRMLEKGAMTVDHLVPVALAEHSAVARWVLSALGASSGVNDMQNLVPACPACNSHKADKGGLWIARGILGRYGAYWVVVRLAQAMVVVGMAIAAWIFLQNPSCFLQAVRETAETWSSMMGDFALRVLT